MRVLESASSCNENLGERGGETVGETEEEGGEEGGWLDQLYLLSGNKLTGVCFGSIVWCAGRHPVSRPPWTTSSLGCLSARLS